MNHLDEAKVGIMPSSENEFGINPFDNDLKIKWILEKNQIIINEKDKSHKNLSAAFIDFTRSKLPHLL